MIRKLARPSTIAWAGFTCKSGCSENWSWVCEVWRRSDNYSVCWTKFGCCSWVWRNNT